MQNKIIPYDPKLKQLARNLRNNSTLSEVLLWQQIKSKALGVEFHRQVPIDRFIVDFFCHEIRLAVEIDGNSHDFKYEYDNRREGILKKLGVTFIRFDDLQVKNDMVSVLGALDKKIKELKS
ncbi:MAG: DUF559 domain-containing protein [Bacteroidales bacterium]|nr:DUF559 domain-containing protein [Bacteroidales bacterium]HQN93680.1 DUF559 domain-containing protein [Prolixibacteraceae bacterium]